jgi:hypothetical protein
VNSHDDKRPFAVSEGGPQRIAQNFAANLSHWAANYVVSALAISLVAVLMNPSFLIVSLVLGALWLYSSLYMQDISVPLGASHHSDWHARAQHCSHCDHRRALLRGQRHLDAALDCRRLCRRHCLACLFRVPEDQATEADFSLGEVV